MALTLTIDERTEREQRMHWSTRQLARLLKINHNHAASAWRPAGLQPHRFEQYMQSDDLGFERKTADVRRGRRRAGLLNRLENAGDRRSPVRFHRRGAFT
jgi:hypothetical protein